MLNSYLRSAMSDAKVSPFQYSADEFQGELSCEFTGVAPSFSLCGMARGFWDRVDLGLVSIGPGNLHQLPAGRQRHHASVGSREKLRCGLCAVSARAEIFHITCC